VLVGANSILAPTVKNLAPTVDFEKSTRISTRVLGAGGQRLKRF
jgi:hypothetical protein